MNTSDGFTYGTNTELAKLEIAKRVSSTRETNAPAHVVFQSMSVTGNALQSYLRLRITTMHMKYGALMVSRVKSSSIFIHLGTG